MVVQDLESVQADLSRAPAGSAASMTPLFGVTADELSKLSEDGNSEYLEQLGGVGFSSLLCILRLRFGPLRALRFA